MNTISGKSAKSVRQYCCVCVLPIFHTIFYTVFPLGSPGDGRERGGWNCKFHGKHIYVNVWKIWRLFGNAPGIFIWGSAVLGGGGSNPASRNVKILMTCKTCKISGERGKLPLKGVCHEIFDLYCFHDSIPFGSLISRLKHFRIIFKFHRDIQIFKKLHGVQLTSESIVPNFSGVMNTKS